MGLIEDIFSGEPLELDDMIVDCLIPSEEEQDEDQEDK